MSPRSAEFMAEARERLRGSRLLIGGDVAGAAVSQAYYAMLYAARAALSEADRYAKTHSGTWDRFWLEFVEKERFDGPLTKAARQVQESRENVDYGALGIDKEEAEEVAALAERFVAAVEQMLSP